MNEVLEKERTELTQIIENYLTNCSTADGLALVISIAGYGKIEDYKKEIEKLNFFIRSKNESYIQMQQEFSSRFSKEEVYQRVEFAKKQAIKEFAKRLYNKYGKSCSEYYPEIIELTHKELNDLLKEYNIGE